MDIENKNPTINNKPEDSVDALDILQIVHEGKAMENEKKLQALYLSQKLKTLKAYRDMQEWKSVAKASEGTTAQLSIQENLEDEYQRLKENWLAEQNRLGMLVDKSLEGGLPRYMLDEVQEITNYLDVKNKLDAISPPSLDDKKEETPEDPLDVMRDVQGKNDSVTPKENIDSNVISEKDLEEFFSSTNDLSTLIESLNKLKENGWKGVQGSKEFFDADRIIREANWIIPRLAGVYNSRGWDDEQLERVLALANITRALGLRKCFIGCIKNYKVKQEIIKIVVSPEEALARSRALEQERKINEIQEKLRVLFGRLRDVRSRISALEAALQNIPTDSEMERGSSGFLSRGDNANKRADIERELTQLKQESTEIQAEIKSLQSELETLHQGNGPEQQSQFNDAYNKAQENPKKEGWRGWIAEKKGWLTQRVLGIASVGLWSFQKAAKMGLSEWSAGDQLKKGYKGVQLEQILDSDRQEIQDRLKKVGMEATPENTEKVSSIISGEKINQNNEYIAHLVDKSINEIKTGFMNLNKTKNASGERIFGEREEAKLRVELTDKLNMLRDGRARGDLINWNKIVKDNFNDSIQKELIYGGLEAVLGGVFYTQIVWPVVKPVFEGYFGSGAGSVPDVPGVKEALNTKLGNSTIWTHSEKVLSKIGVTPDNFASVKDYEAAVREVASQMAQDSGVKVVEAAKGAVQVIWPETAKGAVADIAMKSTHVLHLKGAYAVAEGIRKVVLGI